MSAIASTLLAEGLPTVLFVVVVGSIIGLRALAKWLTEQQKKQEMDDALRRRSQRQTPDERSSMIGGHAQSPFGAQPTRTPQGRAVRRTYGREPMPVPRSEQVVTLEPLGESSEERAIRVADELRAERERLIRDNRELERRLAAYVPPESDDRATEARLVAVRPIIGQAGLAGADDVSVQIQVDLSDPEAARNAVVLTEVLGRPMALRESGGLWNT